LGILTTGNQVSSKPPKKKSRFKEFVRKVGNTLASLSHSAPKPKVTCPIAPPPPPPEPLKVIERPEPRPIIKPEEPKKPQPWRLIVFVKCVDKSRQPVSQGPGSDATVSLKEDESEETVVIVPEEFAGGVGRTKTSTTLKYDISSNGHTEYDVTVECSGWKMIAAKQVSLDDGDKKEVTIEIRPLKWVQFKVVQDVVVNEGGKDVTKEQPVAGVLLDLTLPEDVKKQEPSLDRELRFEELEDGVCKITNMSHGEVWEFVKIT